jgi:hypothetical protein
MDEIEIISSIALLIGIWAAALVLLFCCEATALLPSNHRRLAVAHKELNGREEPPSRGSLGLHAAGLRVSGRPLVFFDS